MSASAFSQLANRTWAALLPALLSAMILAGSVGCASPYHADRGALAGGLTGAGIGALVGNAVGETAGGAAIGAGIGALTGGAIGGALDDVEARNRAEIAAQMGRPVAQGAATIDEVVAMTRSGVDSRLMVNYINNAGVAQPMSAQEVIYLTQQGVPSDVIQAMQTPRVAAAPVHVVAPPPGPVFVEEPIFVPHFYYPPPPRHFYHHRRGPRVGWGVSFSG